MFPIAKKLFTFDVKSSTEIPECLTKLKCLYLENNNAKVNHFSPSNMNIHLKIKGIICRLNWSRARNSAMVRGRVRLNEPVIGMELYATKLM